MEREEILQTLLHASQNESVEQLVAKLATLLAARGVVDSDVRWFLRNTDAQGRRYQNHHHSCY